MKNQKYGTIDELNYQQILFRYLDRASAMVNDVDSFHRQIDALKAVLMPYIKEEYQEEIKIARENRNNKLDNEKDDCKKNDIIHIYFLELFEILTEAMAKKGWLVPYGEGRTEENILRTRPQKSKK